MPLEVTARNEWVHASLYNVTHYLGYDVLIHTVAQQLVTFAFGEGCKENSLGRQDGANSHSDCSMWCIR